MDEGSRHFLGRLRSDEQTGNYRPSMSAGELRDEQIVVIGGLLDLQR
jgi:hypothetical protein